jgi:hypothetical protein
MLSSTSTSALSALELYGMKVMEPTTKARAKQEMKTMQNLRYFDKNDFMLGVILA